MVMINQIHLPERNTVFGLASKNQPLVVPDSAKATVSKLVDRFVAEIDLTAGRVRTVSRPRSAHRLEAPRFDLESVVCLA